MTKRIRKVNELIKKLAAEAIADNVSRKHIATVKAVETSRDLKHAIVWVSAMVDENGFIQELEENKSAICRQVVEKMSTKHTPVISFKIDRSGEHAQRIEELLNEKRPK